MTRSSTELAVEGQEKEMSKPLKFRKKPVVIHAVQLRVSNMTEVAEWCGGKPWSLPPTRRVTGITIPTLEGDMNASFGDWIIKGVQGEFYPCKPDVFAATYEEAADAD